MIINVTQKARKDRKLQVSKQKRREEKRTMEELNEKKIRIVEFLWLHFWNFAAWFPPAFNCTPEKLRQPY